MGSIFDVNKENDLNVEKITPEFMRKKISELKEKINTTTVSDKTTLENELFTYETLLSMEEMNEANAQDNKTNERNVQSSQSNTTASVSHKELDNMQEEVSNQVNKENQKKFNKDVFGNMLSELDTLIDNRKFNNDKQKLADDIQSLREKCNSFIMNINATKQLNAYSKFTKNVVRKYEVYQKKLDNLSKKLNTNDYNNDMFENDKTMLQTLKSDIEKYSLEVFLNINLKVRGKDSFIKIASNKLEDCNTIINYLKKDGGSNDKIATDYINCRNKFNAILNNYEKGSLDQLTKTEFSTLYDSLEYSLHMLDTLNNRYEIENSWLNNQKQIARQNNKVDSIPKRSTSLNYTALIQARNEIASKRTHLETEISNINNESEKKYINQQIKDLKEIESIFNKKINDFKEKWTRKDIDELINCNNKLVERVLTNIDNIKKLFTLKDIISCDYNKYYKKYKALEEKCDNNYAEKMLSFIISDIEKKIDKIASIEKELNERINNSTFSEANEFVSDYYKLLSDLDDRISTMKNVTDNLLEFKKISSTTKENYQSIIKAEQKKASPETEKTNQTTTKNNENPADTFATDFYGSLNDELTRLEGNLINKANEMLYPDCSSTFNPDALGEILKKHRKTLNTIVEIPSLKKEIDTLLSKVDDTIENNNNIKNKKPLLGISDELLDLRYTIYISHASRSVADYDELQKSFKELNDRYSAIVPPIKLPIINNIESSKSEESYKLDENHASATISLSSDGASEKQRTSRNFQQSPVIKLK
ncbi:MAG: hypothetical protein K6D38_02765 [Pseudobutyrivibrio sp.]|nr:hypothetical protein [Pseudobutyrivibrio sp.]